MKKYLLVLGLMSTVLLISAGCKKSSNMEPSSQFCSFTVQKGIEKIGIVEVWADQENKQYAYKDEVFVTDSEVISEFEAIIGDGSIDCTICIDRLPAEFIINIYYPEETLICYYWYNEKQYNVNIQGIQGEITVNLKKMDEWVLAALGLTEKEKVKSPY